MTALEQEGPYLVSVYADGLGEKCASRVARTRADLRRFGWQGFDFAGWARRDLASEWVAAFNAASQENGGAR